MRKFWLNKYNIGGVFVAVGIILMLVTFFMRVAGGTAVIAKPDHVIQGEPVMITVVGTSTANIQGGIVSGSKLSFFDYKGKATALYGVDIDQKTGAAGVTVTFKGGSQATTSFVISTRSHPKEFMAVPEQLGGNSQTNQAQVVSILNKENLELASIKSSMDKALWTEKGRGTFLFPVASTSNNPLVVTNPYGYDRQSGYQTITHKGVDFRAATGTPVYAINAGVVRLAKTFVVYGNSIVIDHGLGLLSMYMHLSRIATTPGQSVEKGQLIGYSGDTGYSEGAHLHLTIRINGVSVDPMAFYNLFGCSLANTSPPCYK